MDFEEWAERTFGSEFMTEEPLTYFRMSATWKAAVLVTREECKQECSVVMASYPLTGQAAADCIAAISRLSN